MDSGRIQFPGDLSEVCYSSNQSEPEADSRGYSSESPPFSPSCHLNLLRLSSESDDCWGIHSPTFLSSIGSTVADKNPCKTDGQIQELQENVSFASSSELRYKFVFDMESTNEKEIAIKSGQKSERSKRSRSNSLNPHSKDEARSDFNQPTKELTSKEKGNSCKDQPRGPRRDSFSEAKEQSDLESAATRENTVSTHFLIPSSSHLALRRKLKRQASRDPLPAESGKRNQNMSCPMSLKSPRKSPVPTTPKSKHSPRASKSPRRVVIKERHIKYHEDPHVLLPSTRKTRLGSVSAMEGPKLEKPLKDRQTGISTSEKNNEIFEERNRNATVPLLPKIRQPNRSSCLVFQKSHWKTPKKSPVFAACNGCQLSRARAPRSPGITKVKHSYFVYPETLRVPRTPTRKICLGSPGGVKTRRTSKRQEREMSRSKEEQKEIKALQKPGETSHSRQQSAPFLPKICQPRHQY